MKKTFSIYDKKPRKAISMAWPFVCLFIPFVREYAPRSIPLIGVKKPLVRYSGFTLIELMITLIVAGVLLGIGVPNLRSFIQNSRIVTQSNETITDIAIARSEAVTRRRNVVICRSTSPTATTPACATDSGGTWETGWIVFMDNNTPPDNDYSSADGDILIRSHEAMSGGVTLRPSGSELSTLVVFSSAGVVSSGSLSTAPHFKLCDGRGAEYARAIVFENTGRAQIMKKSTFSALSCP